MVREPYLEESSGYPPMEQWKHGDQFTKLAKEWYAVEEELMTQRDTLRRQSAVHGVQLTDAQLIQRVPNHLDTPQREIDLLRSEFLTQRPRLQKFERFWQQFLPLIRNPGLMEMMHFINGGASSFIGPWTVSAPSAESLEMAFGQGRDLSAEFRQLPRTDTYWEIVMREPLWRYIRFRATQTARWLEQLDWQKCVILAAGMLPELVHTGIELRPGQLVLAYDKVPHPLEQLGMLATSEAAIKYRQDTLENLLAKRSWAPIEIRGADVIVLNGYCIYLGKMLEPFIRFALEMLAPGGSLIIDLNYQHWNWERIWYVLQWNRMGRVDLPANQDEVRQMIKRMVDLPVDYEHSEFIDDPRYVNPDGVAQPTGVCTRLQKVA